MGLKRKRKPKNQWLKRKRRPKNQLPRKLKRRNQLPKSPKPKTQRLKRKLKRRRQLPKNRRLNKTIPIVLINPDTLTTWFPSIRTHTTTPLTLQVYQLPCHPHPPLSLLPTNNVQLGPTLSSTQTYRF